MGVGHEDEEQPFSVGKLRIDFASHEVRVDGEEIKLTPTEYSLLHFLARNAGRVIPHRVLLEKVWGSDYVDSTDYLKVYIQRLRVKLKDDPHESKLILSERGVGYKLTKS